MLQCFYQIKTKEAQSIGPIEPLDTEMVQISVSGSERNWRSKPTIIRIL